MPILKSAPGTISSLASTGPDWMAAASAPAGTKTTGIPAPGAVVGWVLVADPAAPGGARVDPVFLADGRAWTPDQFRAAYGAAIDVTVTRAF